MGVDLKKHTLNLREGDWDYLTELLNPQGIHTAIYIRTLISRQVDNLRKAEAPATPLALDLKNV